VTPARAIKPLVFLLASLPALLLVAGAFGLAGQSLGPNPVREMLHATGKTALNLLLITLLVSRLRDLSGQASGSGHAGCWDCSHSATRRCISWSDAVLELDLDFGDVRPGDQPPAVHRGGYARAARDDPGSPSLRPTA
jgi:hypothetical protein